MRVVELADELELTTAATLDLCDRTGVAAASGADELTDEQVAMVRAVARAPAAPPPPPGPAGAPAASTPGPTGSLPSPPTPTGPLGAPPPYGAPPYGAPPYGAPPYGAPPPGAPPYGWQPPPAATTDPYAIGALVTAILCFPISWVLSLVSLRRIRNSAGRLSGQVLVYIAIPVTVIPFLIFVVTFLGESAEEEPRFVPVGTADPPGDDDLFDQIDNVTDELAEGDCFQEPSLTDTDVILEVDEVDCAEPHDLEVFAVLQHPAAEGEEYPGEAAIQQFADQSCFERYEAFSGIPASESLMEIFFVYPVLRSWTIIDDRTVVCAVGDPSGPSTGSLRGAGR